MRSRLDLQIEEYAGEGDVDQLLRIARVAPGRVGEVLNDHRLLLTNLARQGDEKGEELLTLTWERLDAETRRLLEAYMTRLVMKLVRALYVPPGLALGEPSPAPYRFQSDEIDLDGTVEQLAARHIIDQEDIIVWERRRRRRNYVMMLDCSGSMKGSKNVWAAIASASLAMGLRPDDQYAVVPFTTESDVLVPLSRHASPEIVVRELLGLKPEGCTDIKAGLEIGLKELNRATTGRKAGILLTDGWRNAGGDPIIVAGLFPRLHVIGLPGGDANTCRRLAGAGRGTYAPVHELNQIPIALRRCLIS